MYLFELMICEYGIEFYDTIWADSSRDAIECAYEIYPNADFIDIA